MKRTITIRGESIELALAEALKFLQASEEEVHVEVHQLPGKTMFGLKRNQAEITVTRLEHKEKEETEQKADLISESVAEARIDKGRLEVRFAEQKYPVVFPGDGVELQVNHEEVSQRIILLPTDQISCRARTEFIDPLFTVGFSEDFMQVKLLVTPGKKIKRTLNDTDWETALHIKANEETEYFNSLDPKQIIEELYEMGVEEGISSEEIYQAVKVTETKEFIVAKGSAPIESIDANLQVHLDFHVKEAEEHERVDFREHTPVPTVREGQLMATYIPPLEGVPGKNLVGQVLPVKPPKEIILRPGKHVTIKDHDIFAQIDGRPIIEWRGKVVKIDVNKEYRHASDVNLESGNIYFDGDVWIGGGVHPSMFVAASGTINVMKNTTKASIRGARSVFINGSIFSSTVTVGIQEKIISMLILDLREILTYLRNIESALNQVFTLRGEQAEKVEPFLLKQAIQLLLEQKFHDFTQMNKQFIQVVKNHSRRLEKEWVELSENLYQLFVDPLREKKTTIGYLRDLIEEAEMLMEIYGEESRPESVLQAVFALNSILYSNGRIHIMSKGVYNCSITALHDITIKGVCRGGEVTGAGDITIDETGSPASVRTTVQTEAGGVIRIGTAYPGTTLQIGKQRYEFLERQKNITALINTEGILTVFENPPPKNEPN